MAELYALLVHERSNEATRFWTIFSLLSILNLGLFAALARENSNPALHVPAGGLGLLFCILWFVAQRRIDYWLAWWEAKLREIEPAYLASISAEQCRIGQPRLPDDFCVFTNRNMGRKQGASTRAVGWLVPIGFMLIWVMMLVRSIHPT